MLVIVPFTTTSPKCSRMPFVTLIGFLLSYRSDMSDDVSFFICEQERWSDNGDGGDNDGSYPVKESRLPSKDGN